MAVMMGSVFMLYDLAIDFVDDDVNCAVEILFTRFAMNVFTRDMQGDFCMVL